MQFSRKLLEEIFSFCVKVHQLLEEDRHGKRNVVTNYQEYKLAKSQLINTYELLQDLRKKFLNDPEFR